VALPGTAVPVAAVLASLPGGVAAEEPSDAAEGAGSEGTVVDAAAFAPERGDCLSQRSNQLTVRS
jgi:hypothetical protein